MSYFLIKKGTVLMGTVWGRFLKKTKENNSKALETKKSVNC
jgi:hypothetical protein